MTERITLVTPKTEPSKTQIKIKNIDLVPEGYEAYLCLPFPAKEDTHAVRFKEFLKNKVALEELIASNYQKLKVLITNIYPTGSSATLADGTYGDTVGFGRRHHIYSSVS